MRNQSLAAPVPNSSLSGISLASRLPDHPITAQMGSFKACLAQGPCLPQGKQEILLGEGTSSIQGSGAGQPLRF